MTSVDHPLIKNDNPKAAIVVVTVEGSFLGEFNNKITRLALKESEKYQSFKFVAVGNKSVDRLSTYDPEVKLFEDWEKVGIYETAVQVKDFLVDEVINNRIGKAVVCYSWPKSFETQKPRSVKLLPCDELISKQSQFVSEFESIIEESSPSEIIGYLAGIWVSTRLFEIFMDTIIASSAAQSQFLDDSVEKMKKERAKVAMKFRKAKKGDIDKSLRETFSARMMTVK